MNFQATQPMPPAVDRYPLAADTMGVAEMNAIRTTLESGQLTMGPRVREFERAFAAWVGSEHAVMVNSGSSANLLIIDSLIRSSIAQSSLQAGDEIIVPGLSWPTTAWPIAQLGLVPVFVDVDPATLAIDLNSAKSVLGPKTRGLFLIHALGRAADVSSYVEFCARNGLEFIEDCCESLGAYSSASHVGTESRAASFSFYFSHHISTIEGGMVVTSDARLADEFRGLRAHGWIRDRSDRDEWIDRNPTLDSRFLFASVGYNVRPTEIQGAIGNVQLQRLDQMLFARDSLARAVNGWLETNAPWLELIGRETLAAAAPSDRSGRTNSWMTLPLRLRSDAPVSRDDVARHFERCRVETRPIIAGNLSRHPAVQLIDHRVAGSMTTCDSLLSDTFMIGCHPILSTGSLTTLEAAITSLSEF